LLNTLIVAVEIGAGFASRSLSLVTDGVHNLSDELALACIYLAFYMPGRLGRQSQRLANLLNSVALVALSGVVVREALTRIREPVGVHGLVPLVAGLASAACNGGVAYLLREPARHSATARLAYVHNRSDVAVSLVPALAGFAVLWLGRPILDSVAALSVAAWVIVAKVVDLRSSWNELIWPDRMTCHHDA
jgi:cobalt-zinc-cadmium efflux system protein